MPQQPNDWQTVTSEPDDWQSVSPVTTQSAAQPEESNWFDTAASYIPKPVKSAWNKAWEPISDLPSRVMKPLAEMQYKYGESGDGLLNKLAMYGGAFDESIGNVLSGLTSPGNLALSVATGGAGIAGRSGVQAALPVVAPRIAQGLTTAGRAIGAGTAAHGVQSMANPESTMFERGMGAIEAVGGGLAAKAPKIRVAKAAAIADDLPIPAKAAPIETYSSESPFGKSILERDKNLVVNDKETLEQYVKRLQNELEEPSAGIIPTEEAIPGKPILDPEAQSLRDQTAQPSAPFNPATLEFVDPKTGEVKPAAMARPGDVPVTPDKASVSNGQMGRPEEVAARPTPTFEQQVLGGNEFQPDMPMVNEPTLGGTSPRFGETPVKGSTLPNEVSTANEMSPKLPQNLAGAKPRFNAGTQFYNPQFESDLDKALYIIAQTRKSTHDARYLKFVMDHTGLDVTGAQALGQEVKASVRAAAKNAPGGDIQIPSISGKMQFPKTGVSTAGDVKSYLEGKSQVDTGPIVPENVAAPEVVASLAQRLKKATEDAGTPNVTAAEDISKLVDEATEVINKLPEGPEKAGIVRQVLGANKALLTSWDLSASGRQGKAFILNKSWWTSLDDMVKAWGSKEAAHNINQSILDHPSGYFKRPVSETGKIGKSFAENMGLDIAAHEEMFTGVIERAGAKIPLVARSSRAHTAFLNKLRSDQFVSMMEMSKKAGVNPETNELIAKSYAKFINDATGRGSLNIAKWKLERNVGVLNDVFFAPKNMSGQIRTWNAVLNPAKYYSYDPVLRKQALKSLFAVAGTGLAVGEMARMAGGKVSNDPTSADFRKIKIGDTRIDMFGGYQQFPVSAMKFVSGTSTSTTSGKTSDLTAGKFGRDTRASLAERFFINRLSPAGSFIYSWMSNREFDGKPFEAKRALYERTFPIAAKDLVELAQEDPELALMLGPATIMGLTNTQTYSGR